MSFTLDLRPFPGPAAGPLAWARVPWDSDTLGIEIVEVRIEGDDEAVIDALPGLLETLDAGGRHLAFVRVEIGRTAVAAACTDAGFHPVETSFELSLPLRRRASAPPVRFPGGLRLRPATADDHAQIVDIARGAFHNDRYHLEPAIDPARADERFALWVQRAFDAGEPVHVLAPEDERVAGFFHLRPGAGDAVDLSLAALRPDLRGSGLGPLLYAAVLSACHEEGSQTAFTRIAAQNLDVLNVYAQLGFQFLRTWTCLHRVGTGEP